MNGVTVRPAQPGDAAAMAAIYAPIVSDTVISFELVPPTAEEFLARMRSLTADLPWLSAVDGGQVVGYAYASHHSPRAAYRWSVDVSVYVSAPSWGTGVGTTLYGELFTILRDRGFVSAYAGITLPNPASVGLHQKLGFAPVGRFPTAGYKFGSWHDVGWWHLLLCDPPADPAEPRPR